MSSAIGCSNGSMLNLKSMSNLTNSSLSNIPHCIQSEPDENPIIVLKAVVLSTIMLAALVGNISIILIVIKTKSLQKAVNFLIVNMAVADCLLAAFAIPHEIVPIVTRSFEWRVEGDAGLALCKVVFIVNDTASVASISSMVCLAIDRFCAVVKPLNKSLITGAIRKGAIILTWVVALGYSTPFLFILKMSSYQGVKFCQVNWGLVNLDHSKAMTIQAIFATSIFGVLPWILVIVLYSVMINEIKKSKEASKPSWHKRRPKYDLKVVKLSFAIVVSFALCNFPSSVMFLIVAFVWKWSSLVCPPLYWPSLWFTARTLVLLYTVLNPCVCFIFSDNFRKGFREIFCLPRSKSQMGRLSATSRNRQSKTTFVDTQSPSFQDELSALHSSV